MINQADIVTVFFFFVPIKITDATIILSRQVVLRKSCVAKSIKCGSTLVKPIAVPLKNRRRKLRVYTFRVRRYLIYENASDDLKLAERYVNHSVLYDLPQSGGIILQQQNARRCAPDSVSGQENRRQNYTNCVVQPENKYEQNHTTHQSRRYYKSIQEKILL